MTITQARPYWTSTPATDAERRLRDCLTVLSTRRQRVILQVLTNHSPQLSVADLATRLVALEQDKPAADVTPAETEPTRISLRHVDLPQLEVTAFVTTSREPATVTLLDHPLLDAPYIEHSLTEDVDAWDDRLATLAVGRHRLIRAILAAYSNPLPRDRLAALVCAHESFSPEATSRTHPSTDNPRSIPSDATPSVAEVDAMVAELHHIHLPILADAGIVSYDLDARTVSTQSTPALDAACQQIRSAGDDQPIPPADCTATEVAVRLVVTPDGRVDSVYVCAVGDDLDRTVAVPQQRSDHDRRPSETATTSLTVAPTPRRESTTRRPEQWLIDCWLRQNTVL